MNVSRTQTYNLHVLLIRGHSLRVTPNCDDLPHICKLHIYLYICVIYLYIYIYAYIYVYMYIYIYIYNGPYFADDVEQ